MVCTVQRGRRMLMAHQASFQPDKAKEAIRIAWSFAQGVTEERLQLQDRITAAIRSCDWNRTKLAEHDVAEKAAQVVEGFAQNVSAETHKLLLQIAAAIRDRAWDT
jgi:hypothetical protein